MTFGISSRSKRPRAGVVVAGGGTAGHLLPGLAVAEELVKRGWAREMVLFVGSARGVEIDMVPAAGFRFIALSGRGLNGRKISVTNILNALGIIWGMLRGVWIVRRERPSVVLSLGGYAALPAAFGAIVCRVPLVLTEQNVVASSVNCLLTRFARAAAVPALGTGLRDEVLTGNPLRSAVLEADRSGRSNRAVLDWPDDEPVVVVFGGSLGSRRINEALWEAAGKYQLPIIHHVVGRRDWSMLPNDLPSVVRSLEYDDDLPKALAAADLVVCRPGGSTVSELAVLGVPAIMIPLPGAPKDHQRRNAEYLIENGLGALVEDSELDGAKFHQEVRRMLSDFPTSNEPDSDRRNRSIGPRDATQRVADLLEEYSSSVFRDEDPKGDGLDLV